MINVFLDRGPEGFPLNEEQMLVSAALDNFDERPSPKSLLFVDQFVNTCNAGGFGAAACEYALMCEEKKALWMSDGERSARHRQQPFVAFGFRRRVVPHIRFVV